MRLSVTFAALIALFAAVPASAERNPPYWQSIVPSKARMRTGPGREFPAAWLYQRAGLPLKVVATYPNWRKVEDPDGASGWMQANLLSDDRTAMIVGAIRDLRAAPDGSSAMTWRAEPGVVGRVSQCARGWCLFDVKGRAGFVETGGLWGVAPDERLP